MTYIGGNVDDSQVENRKNNTNHQKRLGPDPQAIL